MLQLIVYKLWLFFISKKDKRAVALLHKILFYYTLSCPIKLLKQEFAQFHEHSLPLPNQIWTFIIKYLRHLLVISSKFPYLPYLQTKDKEEEWLFAMKEVSIVELAMLRENKSYLCTNQIQNTKFTKQIFDIVIDGK